MKRVTISALVLFGVFTALGATLQNPSQRFVTLDVFIDSGSRPLAAYQVRAKDRSGRVALVGIEGGEHPAFAEPPHYDPRALRADRVVIAAFDTGRELPSGETRVATLHVRVPAGVAIDYEVTLEVVAGPDVEIMDAKVDLRRRD